MRCPFKVTISSPEELGVLYGRCFYWEPYVLQHRQPHPVPVRSVVLRIWQRLEEWPQSSPWVPLAQKG